MMQGAARYANAVFPGEPAQLGHGVAERSDLLSGEAPDLGHWGLSARSAVACPDSAGARGKVPVLRATGACLAPFSQALALPPLYADARPASGPGGYSDEPPF